MQLLDMYAKYLEEHQEMELVKTDYGFASFRVQPGGIFYVKDLFIAPEHRGKKQCQELGNKLVKIAKEKGCDKFYGSVAIGTPNTNRSARMLLDFNMQIVSATPDIVYFCKEI